MAKLGEYEYPTLATFKDALDLATAALDYGGIISNTDAARTLGYKVGEDGRLSGPIYLRFDDLCRFGLLVREKGKKGTMRLTPLGEEAVNKDDFQKADAGKIKAIRSIEIIAKAFDAWNGVVPDTTALQGKLSTLTGIDYADCREHVTPLSKLFQEGFPVLKAGIGGTAKPLAPTDGKDIGDRGVMHESTFERSPGRMDDRFGELRTRIGTVILTGKATIDLAIKHLEVLKEQIDEEAKAQSLGETSA